MAHGAPALGRFSSDEYFALVDRGVLAPDDRVELLEGVVVSMSPINPSHAVAVEMVAETLRRAFGAGFAVRTQHPFVADPRSVPQPDVAVVVGEHRDYAHAHPRTALLVIEVADTTVAQDRLTKAAIYAGAAVPQYLIVNLRDRRVEVLTAPDPTNRVHGRRRIARPGGTVALLAKRGVRLRVDDLLPPR